MQMRFIFAAGAAAFTAGCRGAPEQHRPVVLASPEDTSQPDARHFDRGAASAGLNRARQSAKEECFHDEPQRVHVHVVFVSTGKVESATVDTPQWTGTPLAACIEEKFRAVSIPPYDGQPITVGMVVR